MNVVHRLPDMIDVRNRVVEEVGVERVAEVVVDTNVEGARKDQMDNKLTECRDPAM
jgi:hypothetical protein